MNRSPFYDYVTSHVVLVLLLASCRVYVVTVPTKNSQEEYKTDTVVLIQVVIRTPIPLKYTQENCQVNLSTSHKPTILGLVCASISLILYFILEMLLTFP